MRNPERYATFSDDFHFFVLNEAWSFDNEGERGQSHEDIGAKTDKPLVKAVTGGLSGGSTKILGKVAMLARAESS